MKFKKWVHTFFIILMILFIFIGIFNYVIDPYGLYRVYEKKGINQQKEGVRTSIRYVKALEIALRKPKTIIMGSSRVHDSINPEYEGLNNYQPAYNYGFDMARIKEIKLYLQHAIKNAPIENLFIGLDYFMFNQYERFNITYDKNLVNRKISFLDLYFKPLFTISSLKNSFDTIKISSLQRGRKEFLSNGYRPAESVFYGLKSYEKLHKLTNWIFLSSRENQTLYYAKMLHDRESINDLSEIIKICKDNDIKLILYLSPAHANLDGEGLLATGLYEDFENWKRTIVYLAEKNAINIYDFSGYNNITEEKVVTPMKNYWDSSHFTESIGNRILDIITKNITATDYFGKKLTSQNIEEHIRSNRSEMKLYHQKNKKALRKLHIMYDKSLRGLIQDKEVVKGIF